MDTQDKLEFVESIVSRVLAEIQADIQTGKIPESWDGIELRWLLAERMNGITYTGSKKRKADYNNTVIINNL
jgi:hypothetical protein